MCMYVCMYVLIHIIEPHESLDFLCMYVYIYIYTNRTPDDLVVLIQVRTIINTEVQCGCSARLQTS